MKKVIIILLVCCIFSELLIMCNDNQNVYGSTEKYALARSKKYIKVKVQSVTKKQIKLKITNKGERRFCYWGGFVLKKRVKNKWKKVQFNGCFSKTQETWGKSSTIAKFKWKKFLGQNLSKGRYKMKYARFYKTFRIK